MDQLENVYFPRVSQYRFCQLMMETLPKLREDIKDISMSDLKDFLESIRKHSDKIGETAMKQVSVTVWFIQGVKCVLGCSAVVRLTYEPWSPSRMDSASTFCGLTAILRI